MINKKELFACLDRGEVAILPSDTVYGLFADATNISAIKKVDNIKHSNKPHLIVISNYDMLNMCVKSIDSLQKEITSKYWPGPLTILFEKSDYISDELTKGSNLVGIRMPNNKLLIDLLNEYNKPLLSTSANITNEKVITSIDELEDNIKNEVSFIYDGGKLSDVASTIIKVENNKIVFIREGVLASKIKEDFKKYL